MKAWENWALIDENNVVQNIAVFEPGSYTEAQHLAQAALGGDAYAIDITYFAAHIFDTYNRETDTFHRVNEDGSEETIERNPTEEDDIAAHETRLMMSESAIDDLAIAILEG